MENLYGIILGIAIFEFMAIMMININIAGYLLLGTFWFPLMTTLFIILKLEDKTAQ